MLIFILLLDFLIANTLYAWNGYDYENGSFIEIDKGELVREGESVEFYDYDSSDYISMDIESMEKMGNNVEIIGTDSETGESRTFEMD